MDVPGLAVVIIIVIVAVVAGFEVGRWWSETARGMFEMQLAWKRRKMYRQRKKSKSAGGNSSDPSH